MAINTPDIIKLEDHEVTYCNFSGREVKYNNHVINREGNRNFCVVLSDEEADELLADGWHVRVKEFDDGSRRNTLQIAVRFDIERFKPSVFMLTPKGDHFKKTRVDENMVATLDLCKIASADLAINPSRWQNAMGDTGIKAYLKTGYFIIEKDEFEDKYADAEDDGDFYEVEEETPF